MVRLSNGRAKTELLLFTWLCASAESLQLRVPAAALRAPAAVMMAWVDKPLSDDGAWRSTDVNAAELAKLAAGPSPSLEPSEIVDVMMKAFQRGTNEDIEELFQFVDPAGQLASEQASEEASPYHAMTMFRIRIRTEPRWRNIAARPHAALLRMRSYEIVGGVMTDPDIRVYMVRAHPFFPDAPDAESSCDFQFQLVRQRGSDVSESAAGCWMVDHIEPKYQGWTVKDPLDNGRCPDVFIAPKRFAPGTAYDDEEDI